MKEILLSVRPEETRLAVAENGRLIDFLTERADQQDLTGRIYKGVVKNVVPAVKGVFVDIGIGQNAFLRAEDCPKGKGRYPTEGSALLVQVIKDSTATKGPLVTGKISFSGRYAALLTDSVYIGVSRKIRSDERERSSGASHRKNVRRDWGSSCGRQRLPRRKRTWRRISVGLRTCGTSFSAGPGWRKTGAPLPGQ